MTNAIKTALDELGALVDREKTVGKFAFKDPMEQILEAKAAYRTALDVYGKQALNNLFKEFVDKTPGVVSICWTQYTPYFNDGDPCTFSVHDPIAEFVDGYEMDDATDRRVGLTPKGIEALNAKDWNVWREMPEQEKFTESGLLFLKMSRAICGDLSDLCEELFGDHSKVTYNIETEEFIAESYDHD